MLVCARGFVTWGLRQRWANPPEVARSFVQPHKLSNGRDLTVGATVTTLDVFACGQQVACAVLVYVLIGEVSLPLYACLNVCKAFPSSVVSDSIGHTITSPDVAVSSFGYCLSLQTKMKTLETGQPKRITLRLPVR